MSVVLSEYRKDEYMVTKDGVVKCRHKTLDKAKVLAGNLAGDYDYVDETISKPKKSKPKKLKKSKGIDG